MNLDIKTIRPFAFIAACGTVIMLVMVLSFVWGCAKTQARSATSTPAAVSAKNDFKDKDNDFYGPLRKKYQIEDALISGLTYPPPTSRWIESEKKFYRSLLDGQTYDVLVVPFQTEASGEDPVGRMLMTYRLELAIEQNTHLRVAPLALVYPALGLTARYYDEKEVQDLATHLGVSRIIWGYAGTRDYPDVTAIQFTFSLLDQKCKPDFDVAQTRYRSWPFRTLSPEMLPSRVFENNLSGVLDFLAIPDKPIKTRASAVVPVDYPVPESPQAMADLPNCSPIYRSYLLQMLAMLAPTDYHKVYLFTQSLTNVLAVDANNPDRKLIEARAYIHLYRRPAAVESIKNVRTGEGAALMDYINANLPELGKKVPNLKPSIKKFLADLELFALRNEYKKHISDEEKKDFISRYPEWRYFLEKRLSHYSSWERASNVELKLLMDKIFPIPGFAFEKLAAGYQITGTGYSDPVQLELLYRKHIELAVAGLKDQLVRPTAGTAPCAGDLLIMMDSVGIHNLLRYIGFYAFTQGRPDEGLRICEQVLKTFEGHPYLTIYKAMALDNTLDGHEENEKNNINEQIFDLTLNALWWNGRQNWVHRSGRKYLRKVPEKKIPFIDPQKLVFAVESDYPFRTNVVNYKRRPESMLLPWEHTRISSHKNAYDYYRMTASPITGKSEKAEAVLADMASRFNGNPGKIKFMAALKTPGMRFGGQSVLPLQKTDQNIQKALYLKEVEANSLDWDIYKRLAMISIAEQDYQAAQNIMLKYPKFRSPEKFNPVGISNTARSAGDLLFWRGAAQLSRPFYELSADLNTGSGSSLRSREYLAVLDRDFQTAMDFALREAKRYDDIEAYSRYITYLHLLGRHDTAWSVFNTLVGRFSDSKIWTSALTGHQIQGTIPQQLTDWMQQMARLSPSEKQNGHIAQFAVGFLVDRKPDPRLIEAIAALEAPPKQAFASALRWPRLSRSIAGAGPGQTAAPVPFYSSFARAYDCLKQKKYSEAFDGLSKILDQYGWMIGSAGNNIQSYVVWAGMKSGAADTINKTLIRICRQSRLAEGYTFDRDLVLAAYEGGTGNHAEAIKHLKMAFACDSIEKFRLFPERYQLVELCEWLYTDSGDPRYRELALQWSRSYQLIQPMCAWAYGVEATLTANHQDKIKDLAFLHYLDPKSDRLSHFDAQLKKQADQWMKKNNPFVLKNHSVKSGKI